jgi:hypothetical protein
MRSNRTLEDHLFLFIFILSVLKTMNIAPQEQGGAQYRAHPRRPHPTRLPPLLRLQLPARRRRSMAHLGGRSGAMGCNNPFSFSR